MLISGDLATVIPRRGHMCERALFRGICHCERTFSCERSDLNSRTEIAHPCGCTKGVSEDASQ